MRRTLFRLVSPIRLNLGASFVESQLTTEQPKTGVEVEVALLLCIVNKSSPLKLQLYTHEKKIRRKNLIS